MKEIHHFEISILDKNKKCSLAAINLVTIKTFAYPVQQLIKSYQQKGLTFLFE